MYRGVVSLLLLPCVLLTQSAAALVHSHCDSMPGRNDLRPHFHTTPAPSGDDHHHHDSGSHSHHHDRGDELSAPKTEPTPRPEPLSQDEHDSNAVFINSVNIVISQRSALDAAFASALVWAAAGLHLPTHICAASEEEALNWTHAPPPCLHACPLYLLQLTLLI